MMFDCSYTPYRSIPLTVLLKLLNTFVFSVHTASIDQCILQVRYYDYCVSRDFQPSVTIMFDVLLKVCSRQKKKPLHATVSTAFFLKCRRGGGTVRMKLIYPIRIVFSFVSQPTIHPRESRQVTFLPSFNLLLRPRQ